MRTLTSSSSGGECHNPSLGFVTKARASKNVGQDGSPRDMSYILGSARECERMHLHTPKAIPTWGLEF